MTTRLPYYFVLMFSCRFSEWVKTDGMPTANHLHMTCSDVLSSAPVCSIVTICWTVTGNWCLLRASSERMVTSPTQWWSGTRFWWARMVQGSPTWFHLGISTRQTFSRVTERLVDNHSLLWDDPRTYWLTLHIDLFAVLYPSTSIPYAIWYLSDFPDSMWFTNQVSNTVLLRTISEYIGSQIPKRV